MGQGGYTAKLKPEPLGLLANSGLRNSGLGGFFLPKVIAQPGEIRHSQVVVVGVQENGAEKSEHSWVHYVECVLWYGTFC